MGFKRAVAAIGAAALAVGGAAVTVTAANAAPALAAYVPVSQIIVTADEVSEASHYNDWHFAPGRSSVDRQEPNGFVVPAHGDALVMFGNGNDVAKVDPNARYDYTSIASLAASLDVVSSDDATLFYQIPVFYDYGGAEADKWQYTTLRQRTDTGGDYWISSEALPGVAANTPVPLGDIVEALNQEQDDARPIGAGFLVLPGADEVLVSSFTANGHTTHFYEEPVSSTEPAGSDHGFVHADDIRGDATSYQGWHEEVASTNPAIGAFETVVQEGESLGLQVTGKSQLVYGYDEEARPTNSLPEILDVGYRVMGVPADGTRGFEAQVPVFFHQEGVPGRQFTTLRAAIPADGQLTADLLWASSRDLGSVPANTYVSLESILDALENYEILGHGFTVESGSALVESVSFNGHVSTFTKAADDSDDDAEGDAQGGSDDAQGDPDGSEDAQGDPDGSEDAQGDPDGSTDPEGGSDTSGQPGDAEGAADGDQGADPGLPDTGGWAPEESDLTPEQRGGITAPSNVVAGGTVTVHVPGATPGQSVRVFLFSEPIDLGTHTVSSTRTVQVKLPVDITGDHRIAVYDQNGTLLGWDTVSIAAPKKDGLSETGGELSAGLPMVGMGLVALGGALLLARRFERRTVRG